VRLRALGHPGLAPPTHSQSRAKWVIWSTFRGNTSFVCRVCTGFTIRSHINDAPMLHPPGHNQNTLRPCGRRAGLPNLALCLRCLKRLRPVPSYRLPPTFAATSPRSHNTQRSVRMSSTVRNTSQRASDRQSNPPGAFGSQRRFDSGALAVTPKDRPM